MARILVACEYSGRVRDAFIRHGHDAWSCDLLPTISAGPHLQCDVLTVLGEGWDLMIAHPPCTHLASSGARWWSTKAVEQRAAIDFVIALSQAPIEHIAIENPVGILSRVWRKPDQIIQPYWFGDSYRKTTCLWLQKLPLLSPTNMVDMGEIVVHGGKRIPRWYSNRELPRDLTFPGMAEAFASQWGAIL